MIGALSERARLVLFRRQAYRAVFLHPHSQELTRSAALVLADLRRVCFADRPTTVYDREGRVDPVGSAMHEARRLVWLRISQALSLDDEKLHRMIDQVEKEETL